MRGVNGQVAIYIIVGIFFASMIVFLAFVGFSSGDEAVEVDSNSVHDYLQGKIEEVSAECIESIGSSGFSADDSFDIDDAIEDFEEESGDCIDDALSDIAEGNVLSNKFGGEFEINDSKFGVEVSVNASDKVLVDVTYPLIVSRGENSVSFSKFEWTYEVDLAAAYESASESVDNYDPCESSDFISSEGFRVNVDNSEWLTNSFGPEKKKMAVLYQDNNLLPTFGGRAISILKDNLSLNEGVEYFDCSASANFMDGDIDEYDVIVITGRMQYQIRSSGGGIFRSGCEVFNDRSRGAKLKGWVSSGKVLWINDVGKHETDGLSASYFGDLEYSGGSFTDFDSGDEEDQARESIERVEASKHVIDEDDLDFDVQHQLLTCPNNLIEREGNNLVGTWADTTLTITNDPTKDVLVLGSVEEAIVWVRKEGSGKIVFDEFILKDNLLERLDFNDDLASRGLAEEYYENVFAFLLKPGTS